MTRRVVKKSTHNPCNCMCFIQVRVFKHRKKHRAAAWPANSFPNARPRWRSQAQRTACSLAASPADSLSPAVPVGKAGVQHYTQQPEGCLDVPGGHHIPLLLLTPLLTLPDVVVVQLQLLQLGANLRSVRHGRMRLTGGMQHGAAALGMWQKDTVGTCGSSSRPREAVPQGSSETMCTGTCKAPWLQTRPEPGGRSLTSKRPIASRITTSLSSLSSPTDSASWPPCEHAVHRPPADTHTGLPPHTISAVAC